jgi:hypothetical protein
MTTFNVDLKWSLWLAFPDEWEGKNAKEAIDALKALQVGESVQINTHPRKEIRSGSVTITRTARCYRAVGMFHDEWNDTDALADTLGLLSGEDLLTDDDNMALDIVRENVPRTEYGEPGTSKRIDVTAKTLVQLLIKVDAVEDKLIKTSERAWKSFEKNMKATQVKD